jgi:hypothetical protein
MSLTVGIAADAPIGRSLPSSMRIRLGSQTLRRLWHAAAYVVRDAVLDRLGYVAFWHVSDLL